MELTQIIRELWRLRLWTLLAAIVAVFAGVASAYKVSFAPPSLEPRSLEYGAAQAQLLVDAPSSPLINLERDFAPLETRANVYARFMASGPVIERVAARLRIPAERIFATGPFNPEGPRASREPLSEERSAELVAERRIYRLVFAAEDGLPTVHVSGQARTAEEAQRLVEAAVLALRDYLTEVQSSQRVRPEERVVVEQLGTPLAGMVNEGASRMLIALTVMVAFLALCVLLLIVATVARQWREDVALERLGRALSQADDGPPVQQDLLPPVPAPPSMR